MLAGALTLVLACSIARPLLRADGIPEAAPNDTVLSYEGHSYACTGIAESKYDPRWEAFPLKFVVATVEGDYLGDFAVRIVDSAGATVMNVHCLGPWLLVDLPEGRYTATIIARGALEKTVDVDVGAGQNEVTVHFAGIDET
jgi:hypothetical protein